MSDLVSIIIPVYNAEVYLQRCVTSLLRQTYKQIEIILVDDGSPDNSGTICDEYAKIDKRVRVIHKANGGAATARNKGLDEARGKYICFVDADDYVSCEYIETLYNLLVENNADIAQCDYLLTFKGDSQMPQEKKIISNYTAIEMLKLFQIENDFRIKIVVVWNKIYKREIFDDIRFPEGIIYEDEAIIPKILFKAKRITDTTEKLCAYFMSENSVMRSGFSLKRLDYLSALQERISFYEKVELGEFYYCDLQKYIASASSLYTKVSDKGIRKLLKKRIREYYRIFMKSTCSAKTKLRYSLYVIYPKSVEILDKHLYNR